VAHHVGPYAQQIAPRHQSHQRSRVTLEKGHTPDIFRGHPIREAPLLQGVAAAES
jgi:hypothetical protein